MTEWFIIIAGTLVTFLERYGMLELANRVRLPMWFLRSLRFVPAALLTAIAVPGLVFVRGNLDLSPITNDRLLAGAVSVIVAWRFRNVLWSMLAGMLVAWTTAWLRG